MKRSRIRPESAKHRAYREELARNTRLVYARAHAICEVCGNAPVRVIHHKLRRSQGGGNDLGNLVGACETCHLYIHEHPEWAYEKGYMVKKSGQTGDKRYTI